MALKLKDTVCEKDCKSFGFSELTGAYNALTDTTGWGAPNDDIANVTVATLDVYSPNSTIPTLTIDLLATGNFPTTNSSNEYVITNTALGIAGKLTDGLWTFVYTVTTVVGQVKTVYQQTIEKITYCNAKCCVDGLFGKIDFDCDECNEEAKEKALDAQAIYFGMVSSAGCGKIDKFKRQQKLLERLCNNTNCCN